MTTQTQQGPFGVDWKDVLVAAVLSEVGDWLQGRNDIGRSEFEQFVDAFVADFNALEERIAKLEGAGTAMSLQQSVQHQAKRALPQQSQQPRGMSLKERWERGRTRAHS